MIDWILTRNPDGNVNYILKLDDRNHVLQSMPVQRAIKILKGSVHTSTEYTGYPLTADDKYFFAGEFKEIAESSESSEPDATVKPKKKVKK